MSEKKNYYALLQLKSAYNYPLDTSILDIFIVKKTDRYDTITRDKFFRKCFIIPQGKKIFGVTFAVKY